jgi:hypothetical protein
VSEGLKLSVTVGLALRVGLEVSETVSVKLAVFVAVPVGEGELVLVGLVVGVMV